MAAGLARVATSAFIYDGKKVGEGRVERTGSNGIFCGRDYECGPRYRYAGQLRLQPMHQRFSGKVNWVQIDLGRDAHDHLITPEERLNLAMARQ